MGRPNQCNPCCGDVDPPDPPLSECDNVLCLVLIDENEQTGANWAEKFNAFEQTYPNRVLLVLDVAPGQVALNVPFLDSTRATSLRYEFDQDATSLIRKLERDNGDNSIAVSNNPYLRVTTLLNRLSLFTWFNDDCKFVEILVSDDGGMTKEQVQATIIKLRTDLLSNGYNSRQRTFNNDDFICPFATQDCCYYSNQEALETACGIFSAGGGGICQPASIVFTQQPNDCTKEDYGCEGLPPEPGSEVYGTCVTNECDQIDNVRFTVAAYNGAGVEFPWVEIDYTLQYSDDNGENWSDSTSDFGQDFSGEPQQISSLLSDWPDQEGNADHDWLDATFESYSSTPVGTLGCVKNTFDRIFRVKAETVNFYEHLQPIYSDTFTLFFWTLEEASEDGQWVEISTIPKICGTNPLIFNTAPIDQRSGGRFADHVNIYHNDGTNKYIVPIDPTRQGPVTHLGFNFHCRQLTCIGRNRPYAFEPINQYLLQTMKVFDIDNEGVCFFTGSCGRTFDFGGSLGYDATNDWVKGWTFDPEADPDELFRYNFEYAHESNGQGMIGSTFQFYDRIFYKTATSIDFIEPLDVEDYPPTYNGNCVAPIRSYIKKDKTFLHPNSVFGPSDNTKIGNVKAYCLSNTGGSTHGTLFANVNSWAGEQQSYVSEYGVISTAPIVGFASDSRPVNTYVLEHPITADGKNGYRRSSNDTLTAAQMAVVPVGIDNKTAMIMIPGHKVVDGNYQVGILVYQVNRGNFLPARYPIYKFIPGIWGDPAHSIRFNRVYDNQIPDVPQYSHDEISINLEKTTNPGAGIKRIGDESKGCCTYKFRSDNPLSEELVNEFNLYDGDDATNFGFSLGDTKRTKVRWLGFDRWGIIFRKDYILNSSNPLSESETENEIIIREIRNNQVYTYPSTIKGGKVKYTWHGSSFGAVPNIFEGGSAAFHSFASLGDYRHDTIAVYHYNEFDPSVPDLARIFQWRPT